MLIQYLRRLWRWRRWIFGAYVLLAVVRIPARTGFRMMMPVCDMRAALPHAVQSLTKVPHLVMFGCFSVLVLVQFRRVDRTALASSFLAAVALGVLVEVEEGATRTGNCRLTDILPDIAGALIALALAAAVMETGRWWSGRQQ